MMREIGFVRNHWFPIKGIFSEFQYFIILRVNLKMFSNVFFQIFGQKLYCVFIKKILSEITILNLQKSNNFCELEIASSSINYASSTNCAAQWVIVNDLVIYLVIVLDIKQKQFQIKYFQAELKDKKYFFKWRIMILRSNF